MKIVTAVIQPAKLTPVQEALSLIGVKGITVTDAVGFGNQKGHTEHYRGAEYEVKFLPKKKLEIAVRDDICKQVIETIVQVAATGTIGDGKIFVQNLESAIRIRTGEKDVDAL